MPRTLLLAVCLVAGCEKDHPSDDPACTWFPDADGDGHGDLSATASCDPVGGAWVEDASDCDDAAADVHPGAEERCDPDQADEDCDGLADDADDDAAGRVDTYADADGDGFGDAAGAPVPYCVPPADRILDATDCDDTDPHAFPGAAELEDPAACLTDVDGDGWGAVTGAVPGTDCDDLDPTAHPGAPERFGDQVDQDCDLADLWELVDGFELGMPDPAMWAGIDGAVTDLAHDGAFGLGIAEGALTTVTVDTTACDHLAWSLWLDRTGYFSEGDTQASVAVQFHDGTDWIEVERLDSAYHLPGYRHEQGLITDPAAFHPALAVRWIVEPFDDFAIEILVDEVRLACPGPDGDGDGAGLLDDCDDVDPLHWSDCGRCRDDDGDGRGARCDLGADCDDSAAAVFPGNPDLSVDGVDDDCNGLDGPGLVDDFDLGDPDPLIWESMSGPFAYVDWVESRGYALHFDPGASATSRPFDTSACPALSWSVDVRRDDAPVGDRVVLEFDDGVEWVELGSVEGNGNTDAFQIPFSGRIEDPAAAWPGFRVRLGTDAVDPYTDFDLDDLQIACSEPDGDGDSVPADVDCDDADPAHWAVCPCLDQDGDDFGADCDLGPDCDDGDGAVHPRATDPFGDGADTNCDGFDGFVFHDDFQRGYPDPDLWGLLVETSAVGLPGGEVSLRLQGFDAAAETAPVDTSSCTGITWSYLGERETPPPDVGEFLRLEYHDGSAWRLADAWEGTGSRDDWATLREGFIADPAALHAGFRMRLTTDLDSQTSTYAVDDLTFLCSDPDTDGDGVIGIYDCAEADPAHWADCGVCLDDDGDGYGMSCDLGADCDDVDASVHPYAADLLGDVLDTDCSGLDGAGVFDTFDAGSLDARMWASLDGYWAFEPAPGYEDGSLRLADASTLEGAAIDLSACGSVGVRYEVLRPLLTGPEVGEFLHLEWWDGASWTAIDQVEGGTGDAAFVQRGGQIDDPAASSSAFRIRFVLDSSSSSDEVYLDDVHIDCL